MTLEAFNKWNFKKDQVAFYHKNDKKYRVVSVDFEENLVGINATSDIDGEICKWVRCENVTILPS